MGIRFNADEVLEMAAQIERNGGTFYRKAADQNEEGNELLLAIAEQEDQHLALFESMREDLAGKAIEQTIFDPDGEASRYLRAMADDHVFDLQGNDPSKLLKGSERLEEIIAIAMQAEKDSIAFFVGLKELIPENFGRDKVEELIKEEMKHIRWLNDKRIS